MLRICVVGSGGVGKSCVTLRFLKNEFTEYYDPTMEETYQVQIGHSGKKHDVEIVDTAGQEEFTSFLDSSLTTGDAFLILYAINSVSSWNDLKALRSKIVHESGTSAVSKVPMVIVGNKKDLEEEREVTQTDAEDYAEQIQIPYIETSAKTGYNVHDAFQLLMNQVERIRPELLVRKRKGTFTSSNGHTGHDRSKKDCKII